MNEATTYITPWSDEGILLILLLSRIEYCVWWNVFGYIVINLLKMKVFQMIIYDISDFIYIQY